MTVFSTNLASKYETVENNSISWWFLKEFECTENAEVQKKRMDSVS